MKIEEYKQIIKKPLIDVTEAFLIGDNKILLGLKKSGIGQGNWVGIGGKVDPGETVEEAAIRELEEEIRISVKEYDRIGVLNFYFPYIEDEKWNMRAHVFLINTWEGEPTETDEMKPQWFSWNEIPLQKMWDDARYWLHYTKTSQKFEADFTFDKNLRVFDQEIRLI